MHETSDPPEPGTTAIDPELIERIDRLIETRLSAGVEALLEELRAITSARPGPRRATMVVSSGDMDRCAAAFTIAIGAVVMGADAAMYFTSWGLRFLRREPVPGGLKRWLRGKSLPSLRRAPRDPGAPTPSELLELARELGVRLVACPTSMEAVGLRPEDLVAGLEYDDELPHTGEEPDSGLTLVA